MEASLDLKTAEQWIPKKSYPAQPFKDKEFALEFYQLMVRSRVLEEKLIKMAKTQDGFFWIGGPGEEAFNVALGLQVHKGQGLNYDFLHLHYRSNSCLLAMGAPMIDFIRQMKNVKTDPFSGGRNFASHVARKEWNVLPVTSTIETQFSVAPGTALAQKRHRDKTEHSGVTVVVGGDAGTAEGDFASALVWSSRPQAELPLLMIVTNNGYGISTPAKTQHGEKRIADRAKSFGIKNSYIDGRNPEKIWTGLSHAFDYVRNTSQPFLMEVEVSRLYGHSSSSGANRVDEECPVEQFEKKLSKLGWAKKDWIESIWEEARKEANEAQETARQEAEPSADTLQEHSFADGAGHGIPGRDF